MWLHSHIIKPPVGKTSRGSMQTQTHTTRTTGWRIIPLRYKTTSLMKHHQAQGNSLAWVQACTMQCPITARALADLASTEPWPGTTNCLSHSLTYKPHNKLYLSSPSATEPAIVRPAYMEHILAHAHIHGLTLVLAATQSHRDTISLFGR